MVRFQNIDIEFNLVHSPLIKKWIGESLKNLAPNYRIGGLSINFCNNEFMLEQNSQQLGHQYYTDILTFDYGGMGVIKGELLISIDEVGLNGQRFNVPFYNELLRVIIHGVLHLSGFNDLEKGDIEEMRRGEEAALSLFKANFPQEWDQMMQIGKD